MTTQGTILPECPHDYHIRLGFNTGMSIRCPKCERRFVPKWWLALLVVWLPLFTLCVRAALQVRAAGAATAGWLGIPLVIGGIGWELLQGVLAMICLLARRLGKLEKLVEIKR